MVASLQLVASISTNGGEVVLFCPESSSARLDQPKDCMDMPQLRPLNSHLLHKPLSQSDSTLDARQHCSAAQILLAPYIQMKMTSFQQPYVNNAKVGHPVPDTQVMLLLTARLLQQSGVSLVPVIQEKQTSALQGSADLHAKC